MARRHVRSAVQLTMLEAPATETPAPRREVPPHIPPARPHEAPVKATCPSCGRYAVLTRLHVATLCQVCHDGIDEAVEKSRAGWK